MTQLRDVIQRTMLQLLSARDLGSSICPSDVARSLEADEERWRALMPSVRMVAARLAQHGVIDVTQLGQMVEMGKAIGPVRLRRGAAFAVHH